MIRALSLAAALALLPVSAAVAEEHKTPAETQLEAAAAAFEARMEAFAARAESIQADPRLDAAQAEARIAALWRDYQPHVTAFTAEATRQASQIAAQSLAQMDVEAVVAEALSGVAPLVQGLAAHGAWAQVDPDQMVTYGLIAQYGLDQALDALDAEPWEEASAPTPPAPPVPPAPPAAV